MGAIFSKQVTNENIENTYQQYLNAVAEADKQIDETAAESKELEAKREEQITQALERQERLRAVRAAESEYKIKRIEELKDIRKLNNEHAAEVLIEILFNYEIGICRDESSANHFTQFYQKHMTIAAFWILVKIPILVPLLWPTGDSEIEEKFHEYPDDTTYNTVVNSYIDKYINEQLPQTLTNVSLHRQTLIPELPTSERVALETKCSTFLTQMLDCQSDDEFVTKAITFIHSTSIFTDTLQWKLLRAMSNKGICSKQIKQIPANYPKIHPEYEFKQALAMLTNICLNHYGRCLDENGLQTTDKSKITLYGGKCFAIPDEEKTIHEMCLKTVDDHASIAVWDRQTYIKTNEIVYIDSDLQDIKYKSYDILEQNETTKFISYVNPTRKYTEKILLDQELKGSIQNVFLSAINCDNTDSMLETFVDILNKNNEYINFNTYSESINPNARIMQSFDYITCCPEKCKKYVTNAPPLSCFVYDILIQKPSMWKITLPINNAMSCAQINYHIAKINAAYSPLYMFARTSLVDENATTSTGDKYAQPTFDINSCKSSLAYTSIQTGYN